MKADNLKQFYSTTLELTRRPDGLLIDQYGRILKPYTNAQGKPDLRPVGVGYSDGSGTVLS